MSKDLASLSISLRSGKKIPKVPSETEPKLKDPIVPTQEKDTEPETDSDRDSETTDSFCQTPTRETKIMLSQNPSDSGPQNSSFNISYAIKLIPEYDGDPKALHRFLQNAKIQYSNATTESDKLDFVNLIKSKLTGRAYNVILRYNDYSTWEEIKSELEKNFSQHRSVQLIQSELFSVQQSSRESVSQFAEKIESLLDELNISSTRGKSMEGSKAIRILNEEMAINNFKRGLRHPLKLIVKASQHTSLRSAIDLAVEEERILETEPRKEFRPNTQKRVQCQYCKLFGHELNQCRKYIFQTQNQSRTQNANFSRPSSNSPSLIHNIERVSHKFCRYCKKPGHLLQECRKREYNNKRRTDGSQNPSTSQSSSHSENKSKPGPSGTTIRVQDMS